MLLKEAGVKKMLFAFFVGLLVVSAPLTVFAQGSQGQRNQSGSAAGTGSTNSAQGNLVQNQNQVSTQNQGEETQLQVATQHMEQLMEMEGLGEKVQNQVREVAQEQVQAQTQIQSEWQKAQSKSTWAKKLFGPDYKALGNLRKLMAQNRLRIERLEGLQNQVANQTSETQLQEAVQALVEQNTSLEQLIEEEETTKSLFGWLVRWFSRE